MLGASRWIQACAVLLVSALSACSGSGGGSTPPAPQPTPAGPITLNSSSLNFTNTGDSNTFTASEPSYMNTFTVTLDQSSCTSSGNAVAKVSPASAPGPNATFTITAGSAAGTCKITVSDSFGQATSLSAVVTITQGVLQ